MDIIFGGTKSPATATPLLRLPHCTSSAACTRWESKPLQYQDTQESITFNPLTPNDRYRGRSSLLTSKCCILYTYSTNIGTEYFKHGIYCPFFSLQNAVCFIILTYMVPVLFTFYIQVC